MAPSQATRTTEEPIEHLRVLGAALGDELTADDLEAAADAAFFELLDRGVDAEGVAPVVNDDVREELRTDRYEPIEHFAAYLSGVLGLDARTVDDRVVIQASRSALVDAESELQERGYEVAINTHLPALVVEPTPEDLEAVLEALEDGVPGPGEGLDVADPVERGDGR